MSVTILGRTVNGNLIFWGSLALVGIILGLALALLTPLWAGAVLAAIFLGLAVLRSIQVGFFSLIAIAALLPFAAIPIYIGFYPTFLDAALLGVLGVFLARILTRRQEQMITSPLDGPVIIFMLLATASFIAGLSHALLTRDALRHFVEVLLAISLFFATLNLVSERNIVRRIVQALIVAGSVEASIGIVLYFLPQDLTVRLLSLLRVFHYPSGFGVLRFIEDDPLLPMRAIATSIDPNVLGGLLLLISALTAPQLFTSRPVLPRVLTFGFLGVLLVCLLLTFSRGSLVGLAASFLFISLVRHRRLLVLMLLLGLALLILPATQGYVEHFLRGLRGEDLATQMRFGEYKDAIELVSRYPWFGVGFGEAPSIDLYIGVSNVYLLMAENMGLIGVFAFFLIILIFFSYTWPRLRAASSDPEIEAILLGLMASIIGLLVAGIFDHYFFNLDFPHSVSLFWLFMGLAVSAARLSEARPRE
ncbi:MAG: O-antigen ligase family protein [Chloroflexi bacterium]|nr:O-antigen ligase family protein [Chloroflexota bacterium]